MMFFNFEYLLWVAPALLLAVWAEMKVHSAYAAAKQEPAPLSGAAAARHILDSAGLEQVAVEETPGFLSDHYDPRQKVLRLSPENYRGRSLAAVGIAAHEAGHAIQDAVSYAPMSIRNAAVPVASFGGGISMGLLVIGLLMHLPFLFWAGILLFSGTVFFQLVNLPVEFNASSRAKDQLVSLGIVPAQQMSHVNNVLDAAAWTYVAATLQSVLTLFYYVSIFSGGSRDE
ncbi:MAG: zinc metallopeptidase [Planctomycetia bacterium]|nr:zinc metallopeptidase [Planctomycetia bacterium]